MNLNNIIKKMNASYENLSDLSDEDFKKEAEELKNNIQNDKKNINKTLDKNLPKVLAFLKEASFRALKMDILYTQIFAGIELSKGNIVEFHPGEGKSLAIIVATYIKFLLGEKVHIMVENDFLLQRDFHKARKIFNYLNLTVGAIVSKKAREYDLVNKDQSYNCDVTYIHPIEATFDYLKTSNKDFVENAFIIIDDIDRIIATQEPTSVMLLEQNNSNMQNLLLIDFIKKYNNLSGIADFALKEKKFYKKYLKKNVILISDSIKSRRIELTDNISNTVEEKYDKILNEVLEVHKYRCPIIIVVPNENELEMMTSRLAKKGFLYKTATSKNTLKDFYNISQAGRLNAVTVITRTTGVDIPLGGDPYYLALNNLDRMGVKEDSPYYVTEWKKMYYYVQGLLSKESSEIRKLGGIYEIITEHTYKDDVFKYFCSRRGEVGSVKFFVSLEDSFFRNINLNKFFTIINSLNLNREKVVNNSIVSSVIIKIAQYINRIKHKLVK